MTPPPSTPPPWRPSGPDPHEPDPHEPDRDAHDRRQPDRDGPEEELDLVASTALDDPTTTAGLDPDRRAQVEARAAHLGTASQALAQPVPLPDTPVLEQMVAAAVATRSVAAPAGRAAAVATRSVGVPAGRAVEPDRPTPGVPRWLAAAAVIVLVVLAAVLAHHVLTSGSSRTSTAASSAGTARVAGPLAGAAGRASSAPASASASGALIDLGSATDGPALRRLVQEHQVAFATLGTGSATYSPAEPTPDATAQAQTQTQAQQSHQSQAPVGCQAALARQPGGLGALVLDARATLGGQPVEVLVYRPVGASAGTERVVAVTPGTCRIVVDLAG